MRLMTTAVLSTVLAIAGLGCNEGRVAPGNSEAPTQSMPSPDPGGAQPYAPETLQPAVPQNPAGSTTPGDSVQPQPSGALQLDQSAQPDEYPSSPAAPQQSESNAP